ncbi:hypothetical protein SK128_001781, partial [Halocaridina rubra]
MFEEVNDGDFQQVLESFSEKVLAELTQSREKSIRKRMKQDEITRFSQDKPIRALCVQDIQHFSFFIKALSSHNDKNGNIERFS